MLRALILLLLMPVPCLAGAWLREAGETYLSYSLTLEDPGDSGRAVGYSAIYLEHGLRADLTIGLDAGTDELGETKLIAFGVFPLTPPGSATRISAEMGLGMLNEQVVLRPGLSVGRPVTLFGRPGWIGLDARIGLRVDSGQASASTDWTLGLQATPRSKIIVQLQQGGHLDDSDFVRIAPSVVFERGPGRHLEIGVTAGLKSASDAGLKLAIWRAF